MRHADYLKRARNIIRQAELDHPLHSSERADAIQRLTHWSYSQCKRLVEELEGQRIFTPRLTSARLDTFFEDLAKEKKTEEVPNRSDDAIKSFLDQK